MKRLTIMTEKGAALKMASTYPSEDAARNDLMQRYRIAVDHLAAYEDTGLTPVEISELKGLWKVVCELYGINTVGLSTNNPLTLEELREMDREWVWVERIGEYTKTIKKFINGYGFVLMPESFVVVIETKFKFEEYGKTWFAYRRKPEEGME